MYEQQEPKKIDQPQPLRSRTVTMPISELQREIADTLMAQKQAIEKNAAGRAAKIKKNKQVDPLRSAKMKIGSLKKTDPSEFGKKITQKFTQRRI